MIKRDVTESETEQCHNLVKFILGYDPWQSCILYSFISSWFHDICYFMISWTWWIDLKTVSNHTTNPKRTVCLACPNYGVLKFKRRSMVRSWISNQTLILEIAFVPSVDFSFYTTLQYLLRLAEWLARGHLGFNIRKHSLICGHSDFKGRKKEKGWLTPMSFYAIPYHSTKTR